jgi:hypothetical protein
MSAAAFGTSLRDYLASDGVVGWPAPGQLVEVRESERAGDLSLSFFLPIDIFIGLGGTIPVPRQTGSGQSSGQT